MFRNALLYVTRKKHRSMIIFVILSVILSCLFVCLTILSTTGKLKDSLNELSSTSLVVTRKDGGDFNKNSIKQPEAVKAVVPLYHGTAKVIGAHVVEGRQKVQRDNVPNAMKNVVTFEAVERTARNVLFQSGVFKLESGHHIQARDDASVLVHEAFAKKNHLKINDSVQLSAFGKNNIKTFKIRGIFSGKKEEKYTGLSSDFSENMMFTSYRSIPHGLINKLELVTDQPDKVMRAFDHMKGFKSYYTIEKAPNVLQNAIASYNGLDQMMRWMIDAILAGGMIVLSLVLVLWMRERIYEIAILLSIGVSKVKIVMQFVFELLLISIPAAITAYIVGCIALGSILGQLQQHIKVTSSLWTFAGSYGLLLAIILLSVFIASSLILLKSPKVLLSQIS